jgi:hypothetical protein
LPGGVRFEVITGGLGPVLGVGEANGVLTGGRVVGLDAGVLSGVGLGDIDGIGLGEVLGDGVGDGVRILVFILKSGMLKFESKLAFVLKLKLASNPRLVLRLAFMFGGLVFMFMLVDSSF